MAHPKEPGLSKYKAKRKEYVTNVSISWISEITSSPVAKDI